MSKGKATRHSQHDEELPEMDQDAVGKTAIDETRSPRSEEGSDQASNAFLEALQLFGFRSDLSVRDNPSAIYEKLTEDHIHKILDAESCSDQRQYRYAIYLLTFKTVALLLGITLFIFLTVYLSNRQPET